MKLFTKSILGICSLVAASLFANNASADIFQHIDNTALDIQAKSVELVREVHHYRHTPQYQHLVQDTRNLRRLATHVHDNVHSVSDLRCLKSDVQKLDAEFHHLENVFCQVERAAARGHGHIHGDTRHVRGLLNALENCIHSLQRDIHVVERMQAQRAIHDVRRAHQYRSYNTYGNSVYRTSTYSAPVRSYSTNPHSAPVRSCYNGRCDTASSSGGFSISRGNLNFRINF